MVDDAIALLDSWIALTNKRTIFSSDDVLDLCLDVRLLLREPEIVVPDEIPEPELVGV